MNPRDSSAAKSVRTSQPNGMISRLHHHFVQLNGYSTTMTTRSPQRKSIMRLLAATLITGLASGLCAGADDKPGTNKVKPEQAFKEWGDYFVGGVWSTTNAQGKKEEARWEWILDKSFIQLT